MLSRNRNRFGGVGERIIMLIYLYDSEPEQAHGGTTNDLIPEHVSSSCALQHKFRGSPYNVGWWATRLVL